MELSQRRADTAALTGDREVAGKAVDQAVSDWQLDFAAYHPLSFSRAIC
jgi:hypothetical protein